MREYSLKCPQILMLHAFLKKKKMFVFIILNPNDFLLLKNTFPVLLTYPRLQAWREIILTNNIIASMLNMNAHFYR